jgi:GntR family transcriptional regulator
MNKLCFLGVGSMEVKFNNRDPVYVQVIQHFKEQMAKGYYEPGQEIPSRRELANTLKINPNTAQRAYKEMEEQGLIFTEGNLPSRITKDEQMLKMVREELIFDAVDHFIHSVQTINVPLPEVLDLVKNAYEKKKSEWGEKGD